MRTGVVFLTLGGLAVSLLAGWSPGLAHAAERHSGTVVKVDSQAGTLVIEEMAVAGKVRQLQVKLAPQARVVLSERIPDRQVTDLRNPFTDRPIGLSEVRPGDFVVVELTGQGEKAEASVVTVTLRGGSR